MMRAAVLENLPSEQLEIRYVATPAPRPDEVLVRVSLCGVCGTDAHILSGQSYRPALPFILGHEPVGEVVDVGRDVSSEWLGQRVVPAIFSGCGVCELCSAGDQRLCVTGVAVLGVDGSPGGFAEFLSLPVHQAVRVPHNVTDVTAASLVDSGTTAFNACRVVREHTGAGRPRGTVLGLGPLGLIAAQLLVGLGYEIRGVEVNEARRSAATALGLKVFERLSDLDWPVDFVVECSGAASVIAPALDFLAPRGLLVLAGYSQVPSLDLSPISRKELTIRGVRSGSRDDLESVLRAGGEGDIVVPEPEIFTLTEINAALAQLRSGELPGKALINPREE